MNQAELFPNSDLITVTPSMVADYLRCPLRFKYLYLERRKGKLTKFYFRIGHLLHSIIYEFTRNPSIKFLELEKSLKEKWDSNWFSNFEEEKKWYQGAILCLKNFWEEFNKMKKNGKIFVGSEIPFKIRFKKFLLSGRIDALLKNHHGEYEILEYKFGHENFEEDLVLLKESYQPLFYYLGLKYGYKIEPALFTFFFLLPNQQVKINLKDITEEAIKKFYSLIEEMFTRKNYPPRKNLYCQDCVFDCPLK